MDYFIEEIQKTVGQNDTLRLKGVNIYVRTHTQSKKDEIGDTL